MSEGAGNFRFLLLLAIARDEVSVEFGAPSNEMTPSFRPFELREEFPTSWVGALLFACPGLDLDGLLGACGTEEDSLEDGGAMSSWVLAAWSLALSGLKT